MADHHKGNRSRSRSPRRGFTIKCSDDDLRVTADEANVLCDVSAYFSAMLSHEWVESGTGKLLKPDWSAGVATAVVKVLCGFECRVLPATFLEFHAALDQVLCKDVLIAPVASRQSSKPAGGVCLGAIARLLSMHQAEAMPSEELQQVLQEANIADPTYRWELTSIDEIDPLKLLQQGLRLTSPEGFWWAARTSTSVGQGGHTFSTGSLPVGAKQNRFMVESSSKPVAEGIVCFVAEAGRRKDRGVVRREKKTFAREEMSVRTTHMHPDLEMLVGQISKRLGIKGYVHSSVSPGYHLITRSGSQNCPTFTGTPTQLSGAITLLNEHARCTSSMCSLRVTAPSLPTLSRLVSAVCFASEQPASETGRGMLDLFDPLNLSESKTLAVDVNANAFYVHRRAADMSVYLQGLVSNREIVANVRVHLREIC